MTSTPPATRRPLAPRPSLVATDLDGTLLDPAGRVSPFTRAVLERVWAAGIETLFVTARPPRWIDELADAVGGHGLAICANGAFVYDVARRTVVRAHTMDQALAVAIADDVRSVHPGVRFALEHATGMHGETGSPVDPRSSIGAAFSTGPLATAQVGGVGKLLAWMPADTVAPGPESDGRCADFVDSVRAVVGDRAAVSYSGAVGLAEIGPVGVSKAGALADWCAERQITASQVWAFGDMPNDIPMLAWAGRSFAVAGAPPEVVAAATDACGGNDEDGVARTLLALLDA